jgi:hypothetical protein
MKMSVNIAPMTIVPVSFVIKRIQQYISPKLDPYRGNVLPNKTTQNKEGFRE